MRPFLLALLGALFLASPAFAQDWVADKVTGDAVSFLPNVEPNPLESGDVVKEGATVATGAMSGARLHSRVGDAVDMESDAIAEFRHGGGGRAMIDVKSGKISMTAVESEAGPLQAGSKYFRIEAQGAAFTLDAHKDFATVGVVKGAVTVQDLVRGGEPILLKAGAEFRGAAKAKDEAKPNDPEAAKDAAKKAEAEAALRELDKLRNKDKLSKEEKRKRSALLKKLADKGLTATKEGLEDLAEDYDAAPPVETPKVGILQFLFGAHSPGVGYVLGAAVVIFMLFGGFANAALGAAAFGTFGNALVLLIGAFLGAAAHDFVFTPELFWTYEPTPGIVTPTIAAAATLVAACFLRKYLEDLADKAPARPAPVSPLRQPRRKFG